MVLMKEIIIVHTKKEWKYLFELKTESDTYLKSPFLNVNVDNPIGQPSRTNADPITNPSGN
ncbi:hypothetical protein BCR32DRAFT_281075 [Anaeromyces robustus]|uniref:Uncharacterized protein n=1 Tax=Anaeromyces robustus TaxID=1754192 RepID=A0A1Y1X2F6_9FUNG|nr:hypothetical protein BCR32DRAFT_281075 [Anaeromyces robustus]|eukprot:ORX79818.1 hypothetical protein BCR32DRAFT_281075 [Anaeromyces robustus]